MLAVKWRYHADDLLGSVLLTIPQKTEAKRTRTRTRTRTRGTRMAREAMGALFCCGQSRGCLGYHKTAHYHTISYLN